MEMGISMPDDAFERVSLRAHTLGMSRSEFLVRAAQRYLDQLDAESLTEQINSALAAIDATDETQRAAAIAGRRVVGSVDDW